MKFIKFSLGLFLCLIIVMTALKAAWEVPETGTEGDVKQIITHQDKLFAVSYAGGVYLTQNNGIQWIPRNTGIDTLKVNCIASVDNSIFIGTDRYGIFKSTNLGDKWEQKKDNGIGPTSVYSMTSENNKLYILTDDAGIFMSSDKGENWISINNGDIIGMSTYSIKVANGTVFVGAQDGHIYKTTDNGLNWSDLKSSPLVFPVKAIDVSGTNILAGTSNGIFLSQNNGVSWVSINSGLKNTDITDVKFQGTFVYLTTRGGGVYISDNLGSNWYAVNESIPDMNILCMTFTNTYIFAGSKYASVVRRLLSEIKIPQLTAPTLVSPANNDINVDNKISFSWIEVPGAQSYHLQLALSNDFSNPIQEKDLIPQANWGTTLLTGKEYYWRVATNGSNNTKLWSEVFKFTTKEPLQATILINPSDDAKDVKQPIKFTWHKSSGTASYVIQISTSEGFDSLAHEKVGLTDTIYFYDKLIKNNLYYWRVISVGPDSKDSISKVSKFTAGELTSVYENFIQYSELVEVSPNPAVDVIKIKCKFDAQDVLIDIINSSGSYICTIFNGDVINGSEFSNSLSLKNSASGTYFVKITSPDRNFFCPFVVIK